MLMDLETANYIVTYFHHLLTSDERGAITYQYFLTEGIDQYKIKAAQRVLAENPGQVYFNNCAKCGRLTRRPQSKVCQHCGHAWY
jgi:hypothetical protein